VLNVRAIFVSDKLPHHCDTEQVTPTRRFAPSASQEPFVIVQANKAFDISNAIRDFG